MRYAYAFAGAWPREEPTYCEYCKRKHRNGATQCEGCGAPVTKPVEVRGEWPLSWKSSVLAIDGERLEVTTFRDKERKFVNRGPEA